jgi:hypothetical protein
MKIHKIQSSEVLDEFIKNALPAGVGKGTQQAARHVAPSAVAPAAKQTVKMTLEEALTASPALKELRDLSIETYQSSVQVKDILISLEALKNTGVDPVHIQKRIQDLQEAVAKKDALRAKYLSQRKSLQSQVDELGPQKVELENKLRIAEELTSKQEAINKVKLREIQDLQAQVAGLSKQVTQLSSEVDLHKALGERLATEGAKVSTELQKKIDEVIEWSNQAGYWKGYAEALMQGGRAADSAVVEAAGEVSQQATRTATQATQEVSTAATAAGAAAPAASAATREASDEAANRGARQGAADAASDAASAADEAAEVAAETGAEVAEVEQKGLLSRMMARIKAGFAWLGSSKAGQEAGKQIGKVAPGAAAAAGKAGWAAMAAVAGMALTLLGILGATALLAGGTVAAYRGWVYYNAPIAKQEVNALVRAMEDAITKLSALQFKNGSDGKSATGMLIARMQALLPSLPYAADYKTEPEQLLEIMQRIDDVDVEIKKYLDSKDVIARDLVSQNGWPEAIKSLEDLRLQIGSFRVLVDEAVKEDTDLPTGERGIDAPATKPEDEGGAAAPTPEEALGENFVKVYGLDLNVSEQSPQFRSSVQAMADRLLMSPEGMAFVDPDNRWGGWLGQRRAQRPDDEESLKTHYLESLYWLYRNQIFTPSQLRKMVRRNLPKVGRKKHSAWRDALKYYKSNPVRASLNYFSKNLHKNSQERKISSNTFDFGMRKQADQVSKEYFQDAVKGLSDQYAKSYYTGLKSMYDQKLGNTKADYNALYQLHSETGADLVGEAHPKSIVVSDSMGRGGLVENVIEQHRHNEGVALSMPSGNFRSKHAWVVESLVKLANKTDEQGLEKVSDLIDTALQELVSLK